MERKWVCWRLAMVAAVCTSAPAAAKSAWAVTGTQATAADATTLHEAIEAAWARLPQRRNLEARRGVAAARFDAGGRWFPDAPYVSGTYVNDKIAGSNENYITAQGEVGTPVWLPGEGTATRRKASADAESVQADEGALRLALAAQVLSLVERATLAANEAATAARHAADSGGLAAGLHRSATVGEVAESDALAADADAAQARTTLAGARADLAAALAELEMATGTAAVPRLTAPPAPAVTAVLAAATDVTPAVAEALDAHPRIAARARAVAAAQAQARLVRIENRDNPQVGLQVINEKQPGSPWDTRLGVTLHLPFATAGRNAPRRAQAEAEVTAAEVELVQAQREVLTGIRQAAAQLSGAEAARAAALEAAMALDRRRAQIAEGWRLGEMPLIELVRANVTAFDADLARDKAQAQRDAARVRLQIALGVVP